MKKLLLPVVALALTAAPAWAGPIHPVAAKLTPAYSILLPGVEIDGVNPAKHSPRPVAHSQQASHAKKSHV